MGFKFGSDIDPATKARLDRGERTVEILKQGLHETIPMANEAVVLYCLTTGFLDNIDVENILKFESELYRQLNITEEGKNIVNYINEQKVLPDSEVLDSFIKKTKKLFM